MQRLVSKERTKRTKFRQKQADKAANRNRSWRYHPALGMGIVLVVWAFAVVIVNSNLFLTRASKPIAFLESMGNGVYLLAGLFGIGLFLLLTEPRLLKNNVRLGLVGSIVLVSLVPPKLILYSAHKFEYIGPEVLPFMLTFALAPILGTMLVSSICGIAVGFWTSLAIAVMAQGGLPIFLAGLVTTLVASITAQRVRTRSKVIRAGVVAGITEIACILGVTAANWTHSEVITVTSQAGACVVGGFLSAVLALAFIPFFERIFGLTTDITWLELADLGHPLLQRLALEAPGTYHHSLVVSSLAQAACDEIGANSLIARVCAYFHDIGKLNKPEFFAENMRFQSNPHDNLPPSMSMLVITSHVKEGVSLALLHHLPDRIIDVIREHHGTSVLAYFHHKAKAQNKSEKSGSGTNGTSNRWTPEVEEWNFRYDGPKPTSRESAVIHLADPVEAASRSLEKPTPGNIESLVNDIFEERLLDGQLDNSGLTLNELHRIKSSFIFTLSSIFHGRTPYPKDESNSSKRTDRIPPADQAPGSARKMASAKSQPAA